MTWTEVVLDALYSGDRIAITDTDGLVLHGAFRGYKCEDGVRAIRVDVPVEGFPAESIGAAMTLTAVFETRDIVRIERARGDGK